MITLCPISDLFTDKQTGDKRSLRSLINHVISNKDKLIQAYNSIETIEGSNIPTALLFFNKDDIDIILKWSQKTLKKIVDYDVPHLINSLTRHIVDSVPTASDLPEPEIVKRIQEKTNEAIICLYHYWTYHKEKENITRNVIVELENIIELIIKKERTLYLAYETAEVINQLRNKVRIENLILEGSNNQVFNIRKYNGSKY